MYRKKIPKGKINKQNFCFVKKKKFFLYRSKKKLELYLSKKNHIMIFLIIIIVLFLISPYKGPSG